MLRVPAHPTSLVLVRRYVADIAADARLDRRRTYRLCLAVDEIVTNVLTYSLDRASLAQPIEIWHWNDRTALHIAVEDAGSPYEPQIGALDRDRIEQGQGGLGLFLARTGVDRFDYERRHGRNRHTFEVVRQPTTLVPVTPPTFTPLQPTALLDPRLLPVQ